MTFVADVQQRVENWQLDSSTARANLLTNGGFEIWQRGTSGFGSGQFNADRWYASVGSGALFNNSIGRDSANADVQSTYCWSCTNYTAGSTPSILDQAVETNGPGLRGKPITFSARVRTNVANHIRLMMFDVDGSTQLGVSAFHSGSNAYETLSCTGTPASAAAGKITCRFAFNVTTGVNFIDNAMLVVGNVPADYAPLHPADDLARCQRYYESINGAAQAYFTVGQSYGGVNWLGAVPFHTNKAVSPSVTFSAPSTWLVGNGAATPIAATGISSVTVGSHVLGISASVASGLTAGQAGILQTAVGQAAFINLEANP